MAERIDFAMYPTARTEVPALIGRVDGWSEEEHRVGLEKTRYPVESGSTLTDNAVSVPERLRLTGLVSDILPAPGNRLSQDRATDAWAAIINLAKSRETFDVVTPIRVYRDMLVVRAEAPRNNRTGRALRFTIEMEELLLGQTELAQLSPDQAGGPAEDRTSTVDGGDRTAPLVEFDEDQLKGAVGNLPEKEAAQFIPPPTITPAQADPIDLGIPALTVRQPRRKAQHLPFTGDARQTFRTILGGQSVRVRNWWQPTDQNWYMSLANVDQTPIVTGVRLPEGGLPLAGRIVDFVGQFFVEGRGEPGREAWTTTHRLLYL